MKLLFSSANYTEAGLLKSMLDAADIASEIRNESAQAAYYPGAEFYPELWVINDEDFSDALKLRKAWCTTRARHFRPWTCAKCGEELEGQFLTCWKCGSQREFLVTDAPLAKHWQHSRPH